MLFSLLLLACPPNPPVPPEPVYECKADPSWISAPKQPGDVASGESFCDFYQFGWQWFLAQTSMAVSAPERVFEMQRVFHPGQMNQCSLEFSPSREMTLSQMSPRIMKTDLEDVQADRNALYDQNGNILHYNIWYSPASCAATDQSFVPGTFEIKASWMKIEKPTDEYFTIETSDNQHLAMVGFHMAIWTEKHHEMLWYTWEHKNNAPLCDGSSPVQKYNLASEEASKCLATKECTQEFNKPTPFKEVLPPLTSAPNEVCRLYSDGNQVGSSVNGNDNDLNRKVIDELNEQLVGSNGFITGLSKDSPMKVWSNYEMIGGLWTKDGGDSAGTPVPHKGGESSTTSLQRGSLELTNTTMETFEQGAESSVPNCFGCHHYSSQNQLNVSHIQSFLK